ncbi:MAG TPA: hypothetical protein VIP48_07880 [Streptosporangiaceae bacterium]
MIGGTAGDQDGCGQWGGHQRPDLAGDLVRPVQQRGQPIGLLRHFRCHHSARHAPLLPFPAALTPGCLASRPAPRFGGAAGREDL